MTSIRNRLTRKLLLALFLLLWSGLAMVYVAVRTALVGEFDGTLRAKAMAISTVIELTRDRIKVEFTNKFLQGFDDRVATDFFEIWRPDGTVVERSESLGNSDLPLRVGTLAAPRYSRTKLPNDLPVRTIGFVFTPNVSHTVPPDMVIPDLRLVVGVDRRPLDNTLHNLQLIIFFCGVFLLVATVVVLAKILKTELRPLERLAEQAAGITAESLTSRFPTVGLPTELLPITEQLNALLARLEQSFERERRFSADLAHELRTPLAELRSMAEYSLKWPEERDPSTDRETLAIAEHMEGIVSRMLALVRSERGQLQLNREPIVLSKLIESTWRACSEKAAAKKLQMNFKLMPVMVETDLVLLRSIVGNLLDNAVEYTPENGTIHVEIESDDAQFALRVGNTVENLEESDIARLFDRFWRKEESRTGEDHAGLGLSLARGFAQRLGWALSATMEGKNQLVFTLAGIGKPEPVVV
ncbi:MAG TPA: ATP-binding protein [Opitutaceae bacterium]|nr:ATP-binding protein [Opitutaceae bacterium]